MVLGRRLIEQNVRELPHAAAIGFAFLDGDDVDLGPELIVRQVVVERRLHECATVECELVRIPVLAGIALKVREILTRLEIDDDRLALEVGVEPVHANLARLTVNGRADCSFGTTLVEECAGEGVEHHAPLKLRHPREILVRDDRSLLRGDPFLVSLRELAKRLARLGIDRPGADEVFRVELRATFKDECVDGASDLIRRGVAGLDFAGHLLLVESRAGAEVPEQMAREILAVASVLMILVGGNVDDERMLFHCVDLTFLLRFGALTYTANVGSRGS